MSLTIRVETRVEADATVPGLLFRFGLEWIDGAPKTWLEILLPEDPAGPGIGYWELGTGEDALVAVRELRAALGEIERHLAPTAAPALVTTVSLPTASQPPQTEPASPVAPLAMPPEAITALANRWALARAAVGGAVIPVDTPAA